MICFQGKNTISYIEMAEFQQCNECTSSESGSDLMNYDNSDKEIFIPVFSSILKIELQNHDKIVR